MTDIRETIARLRELYEKTTPGEWWDADQDHIVEAHNAMPALLEYIEKLETMTGAHVIDSTDDSVKFDPKDLRIITKS